MHNAYAQALVEILREGTSSAAHKGTLRRLKEVLTKRGHLALSSKIARTATELLARTERRAGVRATVVNEGDAKKLASAIGADAKEHFRRAETEILVDPSIVGGYRLEGLGKNLDRTHHRALIDLYDRLTT